jgi:Fe-S cluster assembly ATPase SufC
MNIFEEIERNTRMTYQHRKELSQRGNDILQGVLCAMQLAEEIEGVEGDDYINLMNEIGKESSQRIVNFMSWHDEHLRQQDEENDRAN